MVNISIQNTAINSWAVLDGNTKIFETGRITDGCIQPEYRQAAKFAVSVNFIAHFSNLTVTQLNSKIDTARQQEGENCGSCTRPNQFTSVCKRRTILANEQRKLWIIKRDELIVVPPPPEPEPDPIPDPIPPFF